MGMEYKLGYNKNKQELQKRLKSFDSNFVLNPEKILIYIPFDKISKKHLHIL